MHDVHFVEPRERTLGTFARIAGRIARGSPEVDACETTTHKIKGSLQILLVECRFVAIQVHTERISIVQPCSTISIIVSSL